MPAESGQRMRIYFSLQVLALRSWCRYGTERVRIRAGSLPVNRKLNAMKSIAIVPDSAFVKEEPTAMRMPSDWNSIIVSTWLNTVSTKAAASSAMPASQYSSGVLMRSINKSGMRAMVVVGKYQADKLYAPF
eukprot:scaffold294259_cov31-Tisochrysis_lutea.AAC.1